MRLTQISLGFIMFLCGSCDIKPQEVSGVYVAKRLKHSVDTLRLFSNGRYTRMLYSSSGKLIYSNSDTWKYSDEDVILKNYLINYDHQHSMQEQLTTDSVDCFLPIRSRSDKIVIYYGYGGSAEAFYEKL